MRNNESFPLPEREFEHLPARVLEAAEARNKSRSLEITTATYHGELLDVLDGDAVNQLVSDFRSRDVEIGEYFDDSTCRVIEGGYERFKKILGLLPKDSEALRSLVEPFIYLDISRKHSILDCEEDKLLPKNGFARTPTPAEYLVILRSLAHGAERTRRTLEKHSPEAIKSMRRYLSSQDYLSSSAFDHRIKNIGVTVVDPLTMHLGNNAGVSGLYSGRSGKDNIVIVSKEISDLVGTFNHELLHQLSGKRRLERTYNGSHDLQMRTLMEGVTLVPNIGVTVQRVGMAIKWPHSRFNWLNEAVTSRLEEEVGDFIVDDERASSKIKHKIMMGKWTTRGSVAYPSEQALMHEILDDGKKAISFSLLAKAYFEDDNPDDSERLTHWKGFMHAINTAHNPGFLVEVDNRVKSDGVEDTRHTLSSYLSRTVLFGS